MNALTAIAPLALEGVEIFVQNECVCFSGVLSLRDPSTVVTPFLQRLHNAVSDAGLKKLVVDLRALQFMNSSSIRSLVDWVEWIRKEPEKRRYVLHFLTRREATWQHTTMTAIQSFGGEHVVVQRSV